MSHTQPIRLSLKTLPHAIVLVLLSVLLSPAGLVGQQANSTREANSFSAENVLLVVNQDSADSLTLANHYSAARKIPPSNVLYVSVSDVKDGETMGSSRFQNELLRPVTKAIQDRGLQQEIDCIVFSCGFPTRVNVNNQLKAYLASSKVDYNVHFHAPYVSLSSAMFFGDLLFDSETGFLDTHSNYYARRSDLENTRAFRSGLGWKSNESVDATGTEGNRHMLASVLAVVREKGSTLEQAIQQVERASECDGQFAPDQGNEASKNGIFYFASHKDPRSRTRQTQFKAAAGALRKLGYEATVGSDTAPKSKIVLGAVLGSAKHNWPKSQSTFAPGAFCDNFTSYGAWWAKSQTLVTHFLNNGAGGATGMVYEPYTIPYKIPTAFAQYHYARGCTLAEAIYQTVLNPFQMLMVGDPLCRPFADLPEFSVIGLSDRQVVDSNKNGLTFAATPSASSPKVKLFEVYLDGQFLRNAAASQEFQLSPEELGNGFREIRLVAVADHVSAARSSQIFGVFVRAANLPTLKLNVAADQQKLGDTISVQCQTNGAAAKLYHNDRLLGEFTGKEATLNIDSNKLGSGPVTLRAVMEHNGQPVSGVPRTLQITRSKK